MKHVETSEWVSEGKYESADVVFEKDGKFYSFSIDRVGSPFTEWNYGWEWADVFEAVEVFKKEVMVIQWVVKKETNKE